MNTISAIPERQGLSRLKYFLALSRTPHALLDMAAPGLGVLLSLGAFPSPWIIALGFVTAFAGYTAVYALNDLVHYRVDQEKIRYGRRDESLFDLDAVYTRHPMAHGLLSFKEALLWTVYWAILALIGSYLLNPTCTLIFLVSCLLEAVYCLLLRISHLRTFVSGAVKTSGGIAAAFAVVSNPRPLFLIFFFLWLFFWEIGGQNVPNDWADLEESRDLKAKTLPLGLGRELSSMIILGSLALTIGMSVGLFWVTQARLGSFYFPGAVFVGYSLLVMPLYRFLKGKSPEQATTLFNRASYYPLAMLIVVIISLIV